MRQQLLLAVCLLCALSALSARPLPTASTSRSLLQQPPGATLRWAEEFNAASLDSSAWNYVLGDGTGSPAGRGWGNGELECYTNSPANVNIVRSTDPSDASNSWLNISALKSQQPTACYNGPASPSTTGSSWSSAKLSTQSKKSFMWSATSNLRVEARIKIPAASGVWPAFWMLPEPNAYGGWCSSGEIDIMEHINNAVEPVHGTVHYGGSYCTESGGVVATAPLTSGTTADWHVYAVDWAPTYFAFSRDGVEYYRVQSSSWWTGAAPGVAGAPFDKPFYIILNLAVAGAWPCPGGNCAGTPQDQLTGPFSMLVDYIRVWDVPLPPSPPPPAPCSFITPCPNGQYYFCQLGGNANGCSLNQFPYGATASTCSQQCLSIQPSASTSPAFASPPPSPPPAFSPSPAPTSSPPPASPSPSPSSSYPTCTFTTPCPNGQYFYCQAGGNANGCSAAAFPSGTTSVTCSQQCVSIQPQSSTATSPAPAASPSPSPSPTPSLYPACTSTTTCPTGKYYYCTAGGNINGCSAYPTAFPSGTTAVTCSQQCLSSK